MSVHWLGPLAKYLIASGIVTQSRNIVGLLVKAQLCTRGRTRYHVPRTVTQGRPVYKIDLAKGDVFIRSKFVIRRGGNSVVCGGKLNTSLQPSC
jgi:hypothetical protein